MLKKSFNLNLKAIVSPRLMESRLKKSQSDRTYFYLPFIEGTSHILSYQDVLIHTISWKLSGVFSHSNSSPTISSSSFPTKTLQNEN